MIDTASLGRSLRFWMLHGVLNAAPGFYIARLVSWRGISAALAILAGVAFCIACFTLFWSSHWFRRFAPTGGWRFRALCWGTRLRSGLAVASLVALCLGPNLVNQKLGTLLVVPEVYAGLYAADFVANIGNLDPFWWVSRLFSGSTFKPGLLLSLPHPSGIPRENLQAPLPTFFLTLADAGLLTLMVLALSLVCLLVMWLAAVGKSRWQTRAV